MERMNLASSRFAAHTVLAALLLSVTSTLAMAKSSLLYIATQNPDAMGITVAEFDSATGALSAPKMAIETRDPAHFALSNDGKHLYLCNTGTPGGVSAFAVEKGGALRFLNYKESGSADRLRAAHRLERARAAIQAVRALVSHGSFQQVWPGRRSRHGSGGHLQVRREDRQVDA
jgi:hypothetical protein